MNFFPNNLNGKIIFIFKFHIGLTYQTGNFETKMKSSIKLRIKQCVNDIIRYGNSYTL